MATSFNNEVALVVCIGASSWIAGLSDDDGPSIIWEAGIDFAADGGASTTASPPASTPASSPAPSPASQPTHACTHTRNHACIDTCVHARPTCFHRLAGARVALAPDVRGTRRGAERAPGAAVRLAPVR